MPHGEIEKIGLVSTFTLNEVERHRTELSTLQRELEAQINLDNAKMTNIEEHHAFIKDMSGQPIRLAQRAVLIDRFGVEIVRR